MLSHTLKRIAVAIPFTVNVAAAALTPILEWGDNPTGIELNAYIPSNLAQGAGVILAVCHTLHLDNHI